MGAESKLEPESSKEDVTSTPETNVSKESTSESSKPTSSEITETPKELTSNLIGHFLDVGQGDSTFIELPNKETILIDAGNAVDGKGIVEYIKNKGYNTINYLVATHPHADHIGGMATVIEGLDIKTIYMPRAQ